MPSLQAIQDQYEHQGLRGEDLRHALEDDVEYQRLLAEKHAALAARAAVTPEEQRQYVLVTDRDYKILARCRSLEAKRLPEADARLVHLIRAQLEQDWRTPLLTELDRLLTRYDVNVKSQI